MIVDSTFRWLLFLLIPVTIGIILHFGIPLYTITSNTPKAQKLYNQRRLQTQQQTITSIIIQKSLIIKERLLGIQMWKSLIINLYNSNSIYQTINFQQIKVKNFLDINQSNPIIYQSIWYSPTISKTQEMSIEQLSIYNNYNKIEPYIRSQFTPVQNITDQVYQVDTIFQINNTSMLFKFPYNYTSGNITMNHNIIYNQTIKIWKQNNQITNRLFIYQNFLYSCKIIYYNSSNNSNQVGFICLSKQASIFFQQIIKIGILNLSQVINTYYILSPTYNINQIPNVMVSYSDSNTVYNPSKKILSIPQQISLQNFFYLSKNNLLINTLNETFIYFLSGVKLINSQNTSYNQLYILIKTYNNNGLFDKVKRIDLTLSMILAPSLIMTFITIIISVIVIKCIMNDLNQSLTILDDHCQRLIKQEIDLKIPPYDQTQDLRNLFQDLGIINELHQISIQKFFECGYPQKFLKYTVILKLFEKLNYDTKKIIEIMGNCCYNMKDFSGGAQYFRKSFEMYMLQVNRNYKSFNHLIKIKKDKIKSQTLYTDKYCELQYNLKNILNKRILCIMWSINFKQPNLDLQHCFTMFKKLAHPYYDSIDYIAVRLYQTRYFILRNQLSKAEDRINESLKLLKKYTKTYNSGKYDRPMLQTWTDPQITTSYIAFVQATYYYMKKNIPQAFKFYIKALQTQNTFTPQVSTRVAIQIKKILKDQNMLTQKIQNNWYLKQNIQDSEAEFIFLFDWSINKRFPKQQIKKQNFMLIKKAHQIFINYVKNNDRLSIIRFAEESHTICTLTYKHKNTQFLSQQIQSLLKLKQSYIQSNFLEALDSVLKRTKNLVERKILIVFIKKHTKFDKKQVQQLLKNNNKDVLLLILKIELVDQKSTLYYLLNINDDDAFIRILKQKKQISCKNSIVNF